MTIDIQVAAEAAVEAADVAETLIQQFLASGDWQVSEKPDNTPVTEVDVAVEKLIRERLTTALPVADFYGEETGRQSGDQSGTASGTGAQAGGPADSRWRLTRSMEQRASYAIYLIFRRKLPWRSVVNWLWVSQMHPLTVSVW